MIPVLFKADETDFNNNGIGLLVDAISCIVTEERNGAYEIELQYPVTGQHFSEITGGSIIKAKPNEFSEPQLFTIYNHSKPINGICTFYGEHISYRLNCLPIKKCSASGVTALAAMDALLSSASELVEHKFIPWSDVDTVGGIDITTPCSVRACLGGSEKSILNVWGGEFEFDNFTIKLHASRGKDTEVVIEYGKNLTDIKQEQNISAVYTGVLPYAKYATESSSTDGTDSEEITVTLPENVVYCENPYRYGSPRIEVKDFTNEFKDGETINADNLRQKATEYVASGIDKPKVNITASFIQLWQTTDYKDIAPLERVTLCDTVTVRFVKLGVDVKAKIIKTVYDSIRECYTSVEIGDAKSNFADSMNSTKQEIEKTKESVKKETSAAQKRWEAAIKNATELITGQKGGYVVLNPSENPQEILIMDSPSIKEAVKIWRWNSAGLGYSSNGYNGPYSTAITQDGSIVADFITTGLFEGALIKAGTVSAEAISQTYTEEILDKTGEIVADVEQRFTASAGELSSQITKVSDDVEEISTSIEQNTEKISLAVSRIDTLDLTTSSLEASITTTADGIRAEVQEEFVGVKDNISSLQSQIDINASGIRSVVTKVYGATIEGDGTPTEYSKSQAAEDIPLDESCLYYDRIAEKYYSYDVLDEDWIECDGSGSVQTAFLQMADGFYMNGDLIMDGTIKASSIDTNELYCTRLYAKDCPDDFNVRLNGNYGDFGIFTRNAGDDASSEDSTCMWGVYNDIGVVQQFVYGNMWLAHNLETEKTKPHGEWDFSEATVSNLKATAVFGA